MPVGGTFQRRYVSLSLSAAIVFLAGGIPLTAMATGRSSTSLSASAGPLGIGPGIMNHPVHVLPSALMSVPDGWPLDEEGGITCLTCHMRIPTDVSGFDPRLRDFSHDGGHPEDFCAKCHDSGDGESAASVHWLALGRAHVGAGLESSDPGVPALDKHSRECLTCHDGVNAIESANASPWHRLRGDFGNEGKNHPVGMEYRATGRPSYMSPLRPAYLLPDEVPLPEGKVSCISCHDLFGDTPYLLTVPIEGSQLCLTCHAMN